MTTPSPVVTLMSDTTAKVLTPSQKRFQKLIKDIDLKKQQLIELETAISKHQHDYHTTYIPLHNALSKCRREFLFRLDTLYTAPGLSKTTKKKLQYLLCEIADACLYEEDDETVKKIYNKYSGSDYDAEQYEEDTEIATMMAKLMGMSTDDETTTPEAFFEQLYGKMTQEEQETKGTWEQEAWQHKQAKNTRKKSAKALEKEAKAKEAERQISQSIRDIYRQLAKALHPDQEQDPQAREQKTLLMQRVNDAYQNKSLLTLLELQLEVEQIDKSDLENLSEERLSHYNTILKTQYEELKQELADVAFSFTRTHNLHPSQRITPKFVASHIKNATKDIQTSIASIQHDLRSITTAADVTFWVKYI